MKTLMKQVITCMLLLFVVVAIVISCQKNKKETTVQTANPVTERIPVASREVPGNQWTYKDPVTGAILTYTWSLTAAGTDTSLVTSLVLTDDAARFTLEYGTLNLDQHNVRDKDALSLLLNDAYRNIFTRYGTSTLQTYSGLVEKMLASLAESAELRTMKSLVFQSLGMFNTLAKAINRDISQSGKVTFSPFEGYIRGISSFTVEEDEIIDARNFKSFLNVKKSTSPDEGIDYYLNALRFESGVLNVKQVNSKLDTYFNTTLGRWPQGGQCGCCGNYSGPCVYWSSVCLVHDYQCQSCSPRWYCLPGCVASSCSGNTISWYWFLV